jgi:DNA-binding NarL/FixJ family response regulator
MPLEQGALEAMVANLPGMEVVALDAASPPAVLVWAPGPVQPESLPPHEDVTAVLVLIEDLDRISGPMQVTGLFSRQETPASLSVAIRQVARGHEYLSPSLALALLTQQDDATPHAEEAAFEGLTAREREVMVLLGRGLRNKDIAARLYLSVRTVEGHLSSAYAKLGISSRTEAALLAARLQ